MELPQVAKARNRQVNLSVIMSVGIEQLEGYVVILAFGVNRRLLRDR